jgi:hypothetical protein
VLSPKNFKILLAVLNDASPILRFEAVSGRPGYVTDMERRVQVDNELNPRAQSKTAIPPAKNKRMM